MYSENEQKALYTVAHAALLAYLQTQDGNYDEAKETLEDAWQYASHHLKSVFETFFSDCED